MQDALGLQRGLHVLSMMYEHNYEIALHAQCRLPRPHPLGDRAVAGHHRRRARHPHQVRRGRLSHHLAAHQDHRPADGRAHQRARLVDALPAPRRRARDGRLEAASSSRRPASSCWSTWAASIPAKGIDGEGFKFVLQCLDTGRCWVKLSPRISKQDDFPFSDTDPLVKKLVQHAPNAAAVGLGLAASAILQADAERRGAARPDARLGAGREDAQADLRRQSGGVVRLSARQL